MRTSLFLNKIWNSRVPLCCKRSLENVAKCNKYSHMCRKPETQVLKSVTMRYIWRGERRPHSPVFSATLCFWQRSYHRWASLQLSTLPALAAPGTQRHCGSSDRRRQDASLEVERREMSSSKSLSCPERGPSGAMSCAKAAAAQLWPRRLMGTPGDTSLTAALHPTLLPCKALSPQMNPHLKQQQTRKARKLHALQSPIL